jgi:hypothetical protein
MKKKKLSLFVFIVLIIGTMILFSGCGADKYYEESTLILNNSPPGYSFYVSVFPSSILPTTKTEYKIMTNSFIAMSSGVSSFTFNWLRDYHNGAPIGQRLVEFMTGSTRYFQLVNFKGKNTTVYVDWGSMNQYNSLPND